MQQNVSRSRWIIVAGVVGLMLLGCIPRIVGLAGWDLSGDDTEYLRLAALSPAQIVTASLRHDGHPPLSYLIFWGLARTPLIHHPLGPRLISLIPGLLLIPLLYRLGRAAGNSTAGMAFAVLGAFANQVVLQSQTVRQYSLLLCFLALMLIAFFERKSGWRSLYLAASALALMTLYSALFTVAGCGVVEFLRLLRERQVRDAVDWSLLHVPLVLLVAVELGLYLTSGPIPGQTYMRSAMLGSVGSVPERTAEVVSSLVFGDAPLRWLAPASIVASIAWLAVRRRHVLCLISLVPLALNLVCAAAGLFPFAANRWSLHLLPTLFLPPVVALGALRDRLDRRHWAWTAAVATLAFLVVEITTPRGGLFRPDEMRKYDELGAHWNRKLADVQAVSAMLEQRSALSPIALIVGQDEVRRRPFDIELGVGSRQLAARSALLECDVWSLGPPDVASCVRATLDSSPVQGPLWVIVDAGPGKGRFQDANDCLSIAERFDLETLTLLRLEANVAETINRCSSSLRSVHVRAVSGVPQS